MCEGRLRGGSLCSGYGGLDLAVEWVMALPADWVIDVPGLTRRQQLTMLGNSVVPPQAVAALEDILTCVPGKAIT